ncbi:MAG: hypothetical protein ACPMAQ_05235, partial [Phycisphaerae bacterium]
MHRNRPLIAVLAFGGVVSAVLATPVARRLAVGPGAGRELLADGNLERVENDRVAAWAPYEAGYAVTRDRPRAGRICVCCDNPSGKLRMGLSQTLTLNRTDARPLLVSGWSRAEGVPGTSNLDYSIYVDIIYQDGTALWAQVAQFSCGTHDWEYRQARIHPDKPVKTLTLNALFRNRKGRVWFDDLSLKESPPAPAGVVFDGVAVELPAGKRETPAGGSEIHLRDVAAESDFYRVSEGRTEVPELQVAVAVAADRTANGCRRTKITARDCAMRDRAMTLYYVLPVGALGGRWYDNVREYRTIAPDGVYQNVSRTGVGAIGATSRCPFACVVGADRAQSLLIP